VKIRLHGSFHRGWADYSGPLDEHLICFSTLFPMGSNRPIGVLPAKRIVNPFRLPISPSEACSSSHRLLEYPFELMRIADSDTWSIQ